MATRVGPRFTVAARRAAARRGLDALAMSAKAPMCGSPARSVQNSQTAALQGSQYHWVVDEVCRELPGLTPTLAYYLYVHVRNAPSPPPAAVPAAVLPPPAAGAGLLAARASGSALPAPGPCAPALLQLWLPLLQYDAAADADGDAADAVWAASLVADG
eukprot:gene24834-13919_t